jgi:hypothetical protein
MKILLDECVPWPMRKLLDQHLCSTVQQCGWTGVKNGRLLALAEPILQLFITADQSLSYQQNLAGRKIAILRRIMAAALEVRSAVDSINPGEFRQITIP